MKRPLFLPHDNIRKISLFLVLTCSFFTNCNLSNQPTQDDLNLCLDAATMSPEGVDTALKKGANINTKACYVSVSEWEQNTPLHLAVMGNGAKIGAAYYRNSEKRKAMVTKLLELGANPNAKNYSFGYGETPLMLAVFMEDEEVAKLLTEKGADPKIKDSKGRTAENYRNLPTEDEEELRNRINRMNKILSIIWMEKATELFNEMNDALKSK